MADRRDRLRRYLAARGPGVWPCPCCGYRTIQEGPGDYDLCPVCLWEDAGDQLRWPLLADGPNGISLIEAQRNFVELGASHVHSLPLAREPKPGEEREPGWRPIDPTLDDFETGPDDPGNLPWPAMAEELYWWRPTYFRRPENQRPGPAPRRPPSNAAEQMMARILATAPETEDIDVRLRSRWEEPAPLPFCRELAPVVVEAVMHGNRDLALRIVDELNTGLITGDALTIACVSGFLAPRFEATDENDWPPPEELGFRSAEMADFVETWPPEIRAELRRQVAHQQRLQRKENRAWGPPRPDGTRRLTLRWKLQHPIRWWRTRHGGIGLVR